MHVIDTREEIKPYVCQVAHHASKFTICMGRDDANRPVAHVTLPELGIQLIGNENIYNICHDFKKTKKDDVAVNDFLLYLFFVVKLRYSDLMAIWRQGHGAGKMEMRQKFKDLLQCE